MEGSSTTQVRMRGHALVDILMELTASAFTAVSKRTQAFISAQAMARARRELHSLSDRSLRDIGIERSDIDGIFR